MLERKWDAVPPVAFTAPGTAQGQIMVTDTAGFRIKMTVGIVTNVPNQIVPAQVKRILSSTVMILGQVDGKVFQWAPLDLSAFGPGNAAMVGAEQQNKSEVPPDPHYLAVYEGDPVCADRTIPVDPYGQHYTPANTFPVNIVPTTQIPFTLGALAMPTLVSELVNGLNYDKVVSDNAVNQEILTFYYQGTAVLTLTLTKTDDGWILNLGPFLEDFLLLETGSLIELEDGSGELLLET